MGGKSFFRILQISVLIKLIVLAFKARMSTIDSVLRSSNDPYRKKYCFRKNHKREKAWLMGSPAAIILLKTETIS
jgi:hypothetical protein